MNVQQTNAAADREAALLISIHGTNALEVAAMYAALSVNSEYWDFVKAAIKAKQTPTVKTANA